MSGISSGVGLASGINTAQIIEQLLALDARAKVPLQTQITKITTSKTALLDVNARLLAARSASSKFRIGRVFEQMKTTVGSPLSTIPRQPPIARSRISRSARMSASDVPVGSPV